jgi:predicted nucleic acid-binding protein
MRRYSLDTAPLAALLLARPAAVALITPWLNRHEVATSILAYAEVVEYSKDFANAGNRQFQLRTLLGEVYPYFLTYPILERYTDIRRSLRKPHGAGQDIFDCRLAVMLLEHQPWIGVRADAYGHFSWAGVGRKPDASDVSLEAGGRWQDLKVYAHR